MDSAALRIVLAELQVESAQIDERLARLRADWADLPPERRAELYADLAAWAQGAALDSLLLSLQVLEQAEALLRRVEALETQASEVSR